MSPMSRLDTPTLVLPFFGTPVRAAIFRRTGRNSAGDVDVDGDGYGYGDEGGRGIELGLRMRARARVVVA